ncbi:hypothetical protein [Chryseobacterium hagamense]|uniref:C1q domain-containing protein n=1 Tax=Chryseobacterium hagamense TaxID=395935 RepID=A0A511YSE2_9FLAO|nr:hypothetical protein [Chryseobacterium hagamense]GEN78099.1 hypothetical protein CHA01nite_38390 [Chryseobacterium hagamense]
MKKYLFNITALLALGNLSAQVRTVNSATNVSVTNSPAFIDASSNTTVNGSSNIGKGLIFPRVDLSAMTAFPGVTAGIPNSFPTRFDGMIVYNTASSGTSGVGSTQGTLTPGYWYYENKTSSNTGGTWKPMSTATSAVANTASNGLTLSGNDVKLGGILSQATDIATAGNNLTISGTGNVGVGTSSPTAKLEINNGTTAGAIKITDGTQGAGKVLTSDANGLSSWMTPNNLYTNDGTISGARTVNLGSNSITFSGTGGLTNFTGSTGWAASFSSTANGATPNKVVIGTQAGVATIGANNNGLTAWADLSLNPYTGNVGIGTLSPGARLEINNGTTAGALKIVDGTQGAGKVFTSDANGVGKWQVNVGNQNSLYTNKVCSTSSTITLNQGVSTSLPGIGSYTCPNSGRYELIFHSFFNNPGTIGTKTFYVDTKLNGTVVKHEETYSYCDANSYVNTHYPVIITANAGDVLTIEIIAQAGAPLQIQPSLAYRNNLDIIYLGL